MGMSDVRILFVQNSLGTGGAERSNYLFWQFLRRENIEFRVVVLEHRKVGIEAEVLANNFPVTFLKRSNLLADAVSLSGIIKSYRPTSVYSVLFDANIRVRLAKLFSSFYHIEGLVSHVYSEVKLNDPNITPFKLNVYRLIDKTTQHFFVDHFHANGYSVRQHYLEKLKIKQSKISVVHRGRPGYHLDKTQCRRDLRAELKVHPDTFIMIHVGRHEYAKGQDILLSALANVRHATKKLVVLFVGRTGGLTESMDKIGLPDRNRVDVRFFDHRADVPNLLCGSDLFVFPSRFEGLPGAIIEAMSAGLPIICSDIAMNKEVVVPDRNALTFISQNCDDLTEKIIELLDNDELRMQFALESRKLFEERFDIDRINRQLLDLLTKNLTT